MSYHDAQAIERLRERLQAMTTRPLDWLFDESIPSVADSDRAAVNLERWLLATGAPNLYLDQLVVSKSSSLVVILGACQPVADCLIQNPELASLVFDPAELRRPPSRRGVIEEGETLLRSSTSFSHALDRLRYLRQRWNLTITLNDLAETWTQDQVWHAISELADGLISLARDLVWTHFCRERGVEGLCPVSVVGFGKLAGSELNYSSDVDLVYVTPDGLSEKEERDATKYCEALGRALSDRMGRGYLYRVDLRLRPFGGAGQIVRSMRSIEGYYERYAEPWEIQALLRSRPIAGDIELAERWQAMRKRHCFRPHVSEIAVEAMLDMRRRIEDGASPRDLKRGEGGIRDVEFLTQIHQLVEGFAHPTLESANTLETIHWLDQANVIDHATADALADGYTFMRKLEHRIQMLDDRQTHELPDEPSRINALAAMMRLSSAATLVSELDRRRRTIHALYNASLRPGESAKSDRNDVLAALGPYGVSAAQWFDLMPESGLFYRSLRENEGSLGRARLLLERAPILIKAFRDSVSLTEHLLSGEIEEMSDPASRVRDLKLDATQATVATAYAAARATLCAQWILESEAPLEDGLTDLTEALLTHVFARIAPEIEVFALGSFGCYEMGPTSDADLLLLVDDPTRHQPAERAAQSVVAFLRELKRYNVEFEIDLRLRPDGGKGLLVRTYDGFRTYDLDGMEMWERFAFGHARPVRASETARQIVLNSAYGSPLTPERLKELVAMKRRIETERVAPHHVDRDLKLGRGGLNDIEWLVHLTEMRYPSATLAGATTRFDTRIRNLGRAGLLNVFEVEQLLYARRHLLDLRAGVVLQGLDRNLLPENPDKLDRLARARGYLNGNELLAAHQPIRVYVRQLYQDTLERLRA